MITKNITDITRFLDAQNILGGTYAHAMREMENGKKLSHWIWFIFPQLRGLGHSKRSHYFGIANRAEAEAFLAHPILGPRLRQITTTLLRHTDKTAIEIFGPIDAMKVQSCMTLFDCIAPNDIFNTALTQFYDSQRDSRSIV